MPFGSKLRFSRSWIRRSGGASGANTPADLSRPRNRSRGRRPPPRRRAPARPAARSTSQRCAPCHSISSSPARPSSGAVCGSDRRQSAASWCSIASSAARKNGSVWSRRPCQNGPAAAASIVVAAEPPRRRVDRGRRAAQAHDQVAVPPRARVERQRLGAPGVQRGERLGRLHVEAQRRFGLGLRQHLERGLDDDAEDAHRSGDQARDVVAGDVLDDAAAEVHQLAGAREQRDAEQVVAQRPGPGPRGPESPAATMPPTVAPGREMRRLEGQALAVLGELRFERGQAHAGRRGDDELGRLVVGRRRRGRACRAARRSALRRRNLSCRRRAGAAACATRWHRGCARRAHRGRIRGDQNRGRSANASRPRLTCIFPYSAQRSSVGITLPGLSRPFGVEGALDAQHLLAFGGRELHAHGVEFFHADAVLAGDGAAHGDAGFQDVGAKQLAAVQLVGIVGIEQDQRMQVAVAGVEHVGAAQAVLLFHRLRSPAACRPGACAEWSSPCTCSRG